MTKERQLRKQEVTRKAILDAARCIISQEGVKGLSIRKITNAIDYSPAIVYHYFKDKNEILETLVGEGYSKILNSISNVSRNENEPETEIKEAFISYIRAVLKNPDEYKAIMLNDNESIRQRTVILERGISERSGTIKLLSEAIRRGVEQKRFACSDIELTAQILWTSAFGLTMKLIIEKELPEEQLERLLEHHFEVVFNGIMQREEHK